MPDRHDHSAIRDDIRASLDRYAGFGVPTGGFLRAVLESDLFRAVEKADDDNLWVLPQICGLIYNRLPSACWGSKAKVDAWIAQRGSPAWAQLHGVALTD